MVSCVCLYDDINENNQNIDDNNENVQNIDDKDKSVQGIDDKEQDELLQNLKESSNNNENSNADLFEDVFSFNSPANTKTSKHFTPIKNTPKVCNYNKFGNIVSSLEERLSQQTNKSDTEKEKEMSYSQDDFENKVPEATSTPIMKHDKSLNGSGSEKQTARSQLLTETTSRKTRSSLADEKANKTPRKSNSDESAAESSEVKIKVKNANKTPRKKWRDWEVSNLKKGVEQFEVGNWSEILKNFKFNNRTEESLKEKYRKMQEK